jgi:hypothetical protein
MSTPETIAIDRVRRAIAQIRLSADEADACLEEYRLARTAASAISTAEFLMPLEAVLSGYAAGQSEPVPATNGSALPAATVNADDLPRSVPRFTPDPIKAMPPATQPEALPTKPPRKARGPDRNPRKRSPNRAPQQQNAQPSPAPF